MENFVEKMFQFLNGAIRINHSTKNQKRINLFQFLNGAIRMN